jgi:hypothetical protein
VNGVVILVESAPPGAAVEPGAIELIVEGAAVELIVEGAAVELIVEGAVVSIVGLVGLVGLVDTPSVLGAKVLIVGFDGPSGMHMKNPSCKIYVKMISKLNLSKTNVRE